MNTGGTRKIANATRKIFSIVEEFSHIIQQELFKIAQVMSIVQLGKRNKCPFFAILLFLNLQHHTHSLALTTGITLSLPTQPLPLHHIVSKPPYPTRLAPALQPMYPPHTRESMPSSKLPFPSPALHGRTKSALLRRLSHVHQGISWLFRLYYGLLVW